MASSTTFVIAGAGLAGAKAAEALRDKDFTGKIVLVGAEQHLPYERPPLSKDYLADKKKLDDFTVHSADWYRDNDVDLRLGRQGRVDRRRWAFTVELTDGSRGALRQAAAGYRIRRRVGRRFRVETPPVCITFAPSTMRPRCWRHLPAGAAWRSSERDGSDWRSPASARRTRRRRHRRGERGATRCSASLGREAAEIFAELCTVSTASTCG